MPVDIYSSVKGRQSVRQANKLLLLVLVLGGASAAACTPARAVNPIPRTSTAPALATIENGSCAAGKEGCCFVQADPGDGGEKQAIAGLLLDHQRIALLSRAGEIARTLDFAEGRVLGNARISPDCRLFVAFAGDHPSVEVLDLNGAVLGEFPLEAALPKDAAPVLPSLSSDAQWLSYLVWSGEEHLDWAQFNDVETAPVTGSESPIQLTSRGGASDRGASWAPIGDLLAFSDFDENGVSQLLVSNPQGSEKTQLTAFADPTIRIGKPAWSSDGARIVFPTYIDYRARGMAGQLWVVNADRTGLRRLSLPPNSPIAISSGESLWWDSTGSYVAAFSNRFGTTGSLYWLDATSGRLLHSLESGPSDIFSAPFPTDDLRSMVFQRGDGDFYQYNICTGESSPFILEEEIGGAVVWQAISAPQLGEPGPFCETQ